MPTILMESLVVTLRGASMVVYVVSMMNERI